MYAIEKRDRLRRPIELTETDRQAIVVSRELDRIVDAGEAHDIGDKFVRYDIPSTLAPFKTYPDAPIQYPKVVQQAFNNVFEIHKATLQDTVRLNLENPDEDYRYVRNDADGTYFNPFAQIDARGLPEEFLDLVEQQHVSEEVMTKVLLNNMFEAEVSLAMVNLLQRVNPRFNDTFRQALDVLRNRHNKEIALLAVTDPKYAAMRATEHGMTEGIVTPQQAREITGFDALLSPAEFMDLVRKYGDDIPYMLYVRPSLPDTVLKDPRQKAPPTLLDVDDYRRVIKMNAITPNIDHRDMPPEARLNDTKKNQEAMGIAYNINSMNDLLRPELVEFLLRRGIPLEDIMAGQAVARVKPMEAAYGAYGHHEGKIGSASFGNQLNKKLGLYGPYVLQPKITTPHFRNTRDGMEFKYIHRVFVTAQELGGEYMGGFCNMIPTTSHEVKGEVERIHGNGSAHWRAIM